MFQVAGSAPPATTAPQVIPSLGQWVLGLLLALIGTLGLWASGRRSQG